MSVAIDAPGLLRAVGLLADGPAVWGRPLRAPGAGVFLVELPSPPAAAPIDINRVGKWLERVPTLRLDGQETTSKAIAARLASFWIPSTTVLYIGTSQQSIGNRVVALERTVLGDRRPFAGGHWLKTLRGLEQARVWWARTDATEEYEDALFAAFAEKIPADDVARLHDPVVVLPFANLRSTSGDRKAHGLSGYFVPEEVVAPSPPRRVVDLPPGDADGVGEVVSSRGRRPTAPRPRTATAKPASAAGGNGRQVRSRPSAPAGPPRGEPVFLSADGIQRLRDEHAELTTVRRPEVIARIKSAKELGDLKENADYTAAREEQSFLEGRIAAIEKLLRDGQVIEAPSLDAGGRIGLGSRVTVEDAAAPGEIIVYELVGTAEADPGAGRISNASPVGRALIGRHPGESITVKTPRGDSEYRIVEVN